MSITGIQYDIEYSASELRKGRVVVEEERSEEEVPKSRDPCSGARNCETVRSSRVECVSYSPDKGPGFELRRSSTRRTGVGAEL